MPTGKQGNDLQNSYRNQDFAPFYINQKDASEKR